MYTWEWVQQSIDYIDQHIQEPLSVAKVADIANLSVFYYQRLFKKLVGKTVNEYIVLRRLAHAIPLLQTTNQTILSIAHDCGFERDSNFTKVFKKFYRVTPSAVRKNKLVLDVFPQPQLLLNYTTVDLGVPLITDRMFLEITAKSNVKEQLLIGKAATGESDAIAQPKVNPLIDTWQDMMQNQALLKVKQTNDFFEVLLSNHRPNSFDYFVGVPASAEAAGFESWQMPAGDYYVCSYEAESFDYLVKEALYIASRFFFEQWLPQHNITPAPFLIQRYTDPDSGIYGIQLWVKEDK